MNILLFLIPVSMLALGVALWAFIWAVKRGQFEDMDTPALDILREDRHDLPVVSRQPPVSESAAPDATLRAPAAATPARPGSDLPGAAPSATRTAQENRRPDPQD